MSSFLLVFQFVFRASQDSIDALISYVFDKLNDITWYVCERGNRNVMKVDM